MRDTGLALKELGDETAGDRLLTGAAEYRQRILWVCDQIYRREARVSFLPFSVYDRGEEPGSGNYYQLFAPLMLDTGVLPRRGQEYHWVTEYLEKTGRLFAGQGRFGALLGLDAHYTLGYVRGLLLESKGDEFLAAVACHLAMSMDPDVYSMPEVTHFYGTARQRRQDELSALTDWYFAPFPRSTEWWTFADPSTAGPGVVLQYLRNMLVCEELNPDDLPTGNLWVCPGIPREWLAGQEPIAAEGMPTFFGPVSFRIEPQPEERKIRATVVPPSGKSLTQVTLWLRLPDGERIRQVTVNGKPWTEFSPDREAVYLSGAAEYQVLAQY